MPDEDHGFIRHRVLRRGRFPTAEMHGGEEIHLTFFQPFPFKRALRQAGFRIEWFGVGHGSIFRPPKHLAILAGQKVLSAITGWHCGIAMAAICMRL